MGSPVVTTYTAPFPIVSVLLKYRSISTVSPLPPSTFQPALLTSADTNWRIIYSSNNEGPSTISPPLNVAARVVGGNTVEFCRDYDGTGWPAGTHSVDIIAFGQ